MARLRYSFSEAQEVAKRLAVEYIQRQLGTPGAQLRSAHPDSHALKSSASKFPVVWVVIFVFPRPDDIVMDGGELMLNVNIETKEVRPWP